MLKLTRQMPEMHISLVPILQRVPSAAESPQGTINVSSESVQYSSHGSSKRRNIYIQLKTFMTMFLISMNTYGYQNMATICTFCHDMFRY